MGSTLANICFSIFVISVLINVVIDPFLKFHTVRNDHMDEVNFATSRNHRLYGLLNNNYYNPIVFIGDSRVGYIENVKRNQFQKINEKVSIFGFGGITFKELNDLLYFLYSSDNEFECYIIGFPFMIFNDNYNSNNDKISKAIELKNNLLKYVLNFDMLKYSIEKFKIMHFSRYDDKTYKTNNLEWIWEEKINKTQNYYSNISLPFIEIERFIKVLEMIEKPVIIYNPPIYNPQQYKLDPKYYNKYLKIMNESSNLFIDFNDYTDIVENTENFDDPWHVKNNVTEYELNILYENYLKIRN